MIAEPHLKIWTRADYYRMAESGLFDNKRVELIEGQVIEMSPVGSVHATMVTVIAEVLQRTAGQAYFVRVQQPFILDDGSEPEPDLALIAGNARDYLGEHPTVAALLIEVAETTLKYDRTTKARLYAQAGVPEYWIINLNKSQLEVHRRPESDELGYRYAERFVLAGHEVVQPLALNGTIAVRDLLP